MNTFPHPKDDCRNCGPIDNYHPRAEQERIAEERFIAAERLKEDVENMPQALNVAMGLPDNDPNKLKTANMILDAISKEEGIELARAFMRYSMQKGITEQERSGLRAYFADKRDFMSRRLFDKLGAA